MSVSCPGKGSIMRSGNCGSSTILLSSRHNEDQAEQHRREGQDKRDLHNSIERRCTHTLGSKYCWIISKLNAMESDWSLMSSEHYLEIGPAEQPSASRIYVFNASALCMRRLEGKTNEPILCRLYQETQSTIHQARISATRLRLHAM